jgi:hypothetical protein
VVKACDRQGINWSLSKPSLYFEMSTIKALNIKWYGTKTTKLGGALQVEIEITNFTNSQFPAENAFVLEGNYFEQTLVKIPAIPASGKKSVAFVADVKSNRTFKDLERLTLKYRGNNYSCTFPVSYFLDGLKAYKPNSRAGADSLNILLYGIAGATKSSFINSILTLLNNSYDRVDRAPTGGADKHVTRKLTKYPVGNDIGISVNFWDTWGLTPQGLGAYKHGELDEIMNGNLPSGWDMMDNVDDKLDVISSDRAVATRSQRKIHGVLFFVPHGALDNKQYTDIIKTNYEKLQTFGMNPLVILTKADEVCEQIREDPTNTSLQDIKDLNTKTAQMLNIAPSKIFVGINYIQEEESQKVFNIDKGNAVIFKEILSIAYQNIIRMYGEPEKVIPSKCTSKPTNSSTPSSYEW